MLNTCVVKTLHWLTCWT